MYKKFVTQTASTFLYGLRWNLACVFIMMCRCAQHNYHLHCSPHLVTSPMYVCSKILWRELLLQFLRDWDETWHVYSSLCAGVHYKIFISFVALILWLAPGRGILIISDRSTCLWLCIKTFPALQKIDPGGLWLPLGCIAVSQTEPLLIYQWRWRQIWAFID